MILPLRENHCTTSEIVLTFKYRFSNNETPIGSTSNSRPMKYEVFVNIHFINSQVVMLLQNNFVISDITHAPGHVT